MTRAILLSAAAALSLVPAALAAQPGTPGIPSPVPSGAPGQNPYARPDGVDARDLMMSSAARTALDASAADERARQAAARARSKYGPAVAAKPAEIVAQAAVYDLNGEAVGKIETVEADGAVVVTASGRAKVPLDAFGKNRQGLLIGVSKKDFEAQVARANAG